MTDTLQADYDALKRIHEATNDMVVTKDNQIQQLNNQVEILNMKLSQLTENRLLRDQIVQQQFNSSTDLKNAVTLSLH